MEYPTIFISPREFVTELNTFIADISSIPSLLSNTSCAECIAEKNDTETINNKERASERKDSKEGNDESSDESSEDEDRDNTIRNKKRKFSIEDDISNLIEGESKLSQEEDDVDVTEVQNTFMSTLFEFENADTETLKAFIASTVSELENESITENTLTL